MRIYSMLVRRMESIGSRLIQARTAAGFKSARQAAIFLGIPYTTYYGYEKETRGLDTYQADEVAKRFKVSLEWLLTGRGEMKPSTEKMPISGMAPILGNVSAGFWQEIDDLNGEPEGFMPLMPGLSHPQEAYYYLTARGNSMNKVFTDGTLLLCLSVAQSGIAIMPDDIAIVERRREQDGLIETTAKRVRISGRTMQLWPESLDERYQTPLIVGSDSDSESIFITARVVGWFQSA